MPEQHHPDVQRLLDRQAISDCVHRYSRGLDRHDDAMVASCYWDDAIDEHGAFTGSPQEFIAWANDLHATSFRGHQHHITTQTVEIDGDTAHAESYILGVLTRKGDGEVSDIAGGRYLDRLERRDGEWRMTLRVATFEFNELRPMVIGDPGSGLDQMPRRERRGREDPVFDLLEGRKIAGIES